MTKYIQKTGAVMRNLILIGSVFAGVVGLLIFLSLRTGTQQSMVSTNGSFGDKPPIVLVEPEMIDLGTVSMTEGIAERAFSIKNNGGSPLRITNLVTSCMCTTAQLEVNGEKSASFGMPGGHGGASSRGWSMDIPPQNEGILRVFYDPNAHGPTGTGSFRREITFTTNDPDRLDVTVSIKGTVVNK